MTMHLDKAKNVQCLICDVDGVLTSGLLYLDNFGNELKAFHVHDGMGLKLLMAAGITVAVITTSKNAVIEFRMRQLGISHYYTGQVDKQAAFQDLKQTLNLDNESFAFIADDLPDIAILKQVGFSVAVANARPEVKEIVHWQTASQGGAGAVRELCDAILLAQNKLDLALARYLSS